MSYHLLHHSCRENVHPHNAWIHIEVYNKDIFKLILILHHAILTIFISQWSCSAVTELVQLTPCDIRMELQSRDTTRTYRIWGLNERGFIPKRLSKHRKQATLHTVCEHQTKTTHRIHWEEVKVQQNDKWVLWECEVDKSSLLQFTTSYLRGFLPSFPYMIWLSSAS